MKKNEASLDAVLNSPGSRQADYIDGNLKSESLLSKNSLDNGLMSSFRINTQGEISGVVRDMQPSDKPYHMDLPSTAANKRPMARKKVGQSSPSGMHVVLDLPERVDYLTGDYRARSIGNFMLALTRRVADENGAQIFVHTIVEDEAKTIFEGFADDIYLAYKALRGERKTRSKKSESPDLAGLLKLTGTEIQGDTDVAMLVTDFQDGFDKETKTFNWEAGLRSTKSKLEDRLWITRLTSPAHLELPYGAVDGIDVVTVNSLNELFASTAAEKATRIEDATARIGNLKNIDLIRDNNKEHPVRAMTGFILGK
jgi:hypothetical protein